MIQNDRQRLANRAKTIEKVISATGDGIETLVTVDSTDVAVTLLGGPVAFVANKARKLSKLKKAADDPDSTSVPDKVAVGGGRAQGFPIHGSDTITINPDPDALPDIIGIGQKLSLKTRSMSNVNLEGLSHSLLTGSEGRKFFSEAHRVLTKKGIVNGYTGAGADPSAIRDAMKAVGFKKINVG